MSDLIISGRVITAPILEIVNAIRSQLTNGKLSRVEDKGDYVSVTCPSHKGGHESHPSCSIYSGDKPEVEYGTVHCFTCGLKGSLTKFIGECFDKDEQFGKEWLIEHFGDTYDNSLKFETFKEPEEEVFLDESILNEFEDYHPYMETRHLNVDVLKKLKVKYDPKTQCLVFPVRDRKGRLKFLTRRSVNSKKFIIDKGADKRCIYLLDEVIKQDCREVVVCESQINALTCWSWGIPAIALIGAGTTDGQLDVLNKTGIIHYILAYDPDDAGIHGASRFKRGIRKNVFVTELHLPQGKDVNDLTKEEFESLW